MIQHDLFNPPVLNIWQATELRLRADRDRRLADAAEASGDLVSTQKQSKVLRLRKTDLIRLCIMRVLSDQPSFTFMEVLDKLNGCINKQIASALINRLYVTQELGCTDEHRQNGCLNYVVRELVAIPAWVANMSLQEAIDYFVEHEDRREGQRRNANQAEPEYSGCASFISLVSSPNLFRPRNQREDFSITL